MEVHPHHFKSSDLYESAPVYSDSERNRNESKGKDVCAQVLKGLFA